MCSSSLLEFLFPNTACQQQKDYSCGNQCAILNRRVHTFNFSAKPEKMLFFLFRLELVALRSHYEVMYTDILGWLSNILLRLCYLDLPSAHWVTVFRTSTSTATRSLSCSSYVVGARHID